MNLTHEQTLIVTACLIGVIFLAVNLGLWGIYRSRSSSAPRKAPPSQPPRRSWRNPWQDEDEGLAELSRRVSALDRPIDDAGESGNPAPPSPPTKGN